MASPQPVIPDYAGACVCNIVPSILGARDRAWFPEPARDARAIVLLILDGFGLHLYGRTRNALPNLDTFTGEAITTVAPSTTAAVLTSISTGLTPAEHGIVGFRMRYEDEVLNTIRWVYEGNVRPPDPISVQRHEPFLRREVDVVTQAEHEGTGFTDAHLRGTRFHGWSTIDDLATIPPQLIADGSNFVYSYYPKIDSVAHEVGFRDGSVEAECARVDGIVGRLLDGLPGDCALLITADHGGLHMEPDAWLHATELDSMVAFEAGEARFRYLFARDGATDELLDAARAAYGEVAWVMSRDEAFDAGWFGPGSTPAIRRRTGDVIIAPFADVAILSPEFPREQRLIGLHGSLTPAEMLVPLIAARGRA